MKALYALVFVCMSYGALACDAAALNGIITVDDFGCGYNATAEIAAQDTMIEFAFDPGLVVHEWELETTASIPATATIEIDEQGIYQPHIVGQYPY